MRQEKWAPREWLDHPAKMETRDPLDQRAPLDPLESLVCQVFPANRETWAHLVSQDQTVSLDLRVTEASQETEDNVVSQDLLVFLDHKDLLDPQVNPDLWERLECQDPPEPQEAKDQWDHPDPLDLRAAEDLRESRAIMDQLATQEVTDPLV